MASAAQERAQERQRHRRHREQARQLEAALERLSGAISELDGFGWLLSSDLGPEHTAKAAEQASIGLAAARSAILALAGGLADLEGSA
jgi:hypothetical protein